MSSISPSSAPTPPSRLQTQASQPLQTIYPSLDPLAPPQQPEYLKNDNATMTIPQILKKLEQICQSYPTNTDSCLYYLNLFSTPLSWSLLGIDFTNMASSIGLEPIPLSEHKKISSSIITTCKYIIDHHYPYIDDSCELFIIQAQTIARYRDWVEYRSILKYCGFAERCQPSLLQSQRLEKLKNLAYSYKLKKTLETYGFLLAKTWVGFHSLLATMQFYFPGLLYSEFELLNIHRSKLGVIYDEDGNPLPYRDLTPYLNERAPTPEYMGFGLGSRTGDYFAEFAEEMDQQIPLGKLPPHWV